MKGARTVKWFFLAGMTGAMSNVSYALGPVAYFLFWIIPTTNLGGQIVSDWSEGPIHRYAGFGAAGPFLLCFALARWGARGIFEWDKPVRILLVMAALMLALLGGFRSQVTLLIAIFAIQFMLEGLWRSPLLPALVLLGLLGMAPILLFANKMPSAVQRSLAFLPLNIDPDIREDATASVDWRVGMWQEVVPEIPKYLLVGKGYAIDPDEIYSATFGAQNGLLGHYEGSRVAGDYHNGPLSVLIPLGMFGMIAFLWLLKAGIKVLYWNYRYGDVRLRQVNITLLSFFVAQSLFFIFVFGALSSQLSIFMGILGLSVSLNGGVCRRPAMARQPDFSASLAAPVAVA